MYIVCIKKIEIIKWRQVLSYHFDS